MNVEILSITENAIENVFRSYRVCYSKDVPSEIKIPERFGIDGENKTYVPDRDKMIKFIKDKIDKGHYSPLEHCNITFAIEGVSRSLTHQLVRHRIASYSQQSQRYVKFNQFEYVIPPEIAKDHFLKLRFVEAMEDSQMYYNDLVSDLIKNGRTEKQAIEDARYVFPNACCSNIIVTMNGRSFRNFMAERLCKNAQWEIRELAEQMLSGVNTYIPFIDYKVRKCGITCFECSK